jgi:hypothetical protein
MIVQALFAHAGPDAVYLRINPEVVDLATTTTINEPELYPAEILNNGTADPAVIRDRPSDMVLNMPKPKPQTGPLKCPPGRHCGRSMASSAPVAGIADRMAAQD